jgi:predicted CopG family antitoxin
MNKLPLERVDFLYCVPRKIMKTEYNTRMKTLEIPDDVYDLLETYRIVFDLSLSDILRDAFERYSIRADSEQHDVLEEQEVLQSRTKRIAGEPTISLEDIARQLQA